MLQYFPSKRLDFLPFFFHKLKDFFPKLEIVLSNTQKSGKSLCWCLLKKSLAYYSRRRTSVVSGHGGQSPRWHSSLHVWLSPTGPHSSFLPQTRPQVAMGSRHEVRSVTEVWPQGQVSTTWGESGQGGQAPEWQVCEHK